jgi:hypothetical protein
MRHVRRLVLIAFLLALWTAPVAAHELTVASFNVESGGADPVIVAEQIRAQPGVDLWGFSEVKDATWTEVFRREAQIANPGTALKAITGTTGGADRLAVIYNDSRLRLVRHFELRSGDRRCLRPEERPIAPRWRSSGGGTTRSASGSWSTISSAAMRRTGTARRARSTPG